MKRPFANIDFTSGCIHGETFLPLLDDITHATIKLMKGFKMNVWPSFTKPRYVSSRSSFEVSLFPTNSLMYFGGTYIALGTFTSCTCSKPLSQSMRGRPPKCFRIGLRCIQLFACYPWRCCTRWLQRGNRWEMVALV
jgi:hypothetical protein